MRASAYCGAERLHPKCRPGVAISDDHLTHAISMSQLGHDQAALRPNGAGLIARACDHGLALFLLLLSQAYSWAPAVLVDELHARGFRARRIARSLAPLKGVASCQLSAPNGCDT